MINGPKYLRGRTNEFVLMSLLVVTERWAVVPNAEMTGRSGGRAPVLYQVHINTPLADFDTTKCGVRVSVEAKLKTKVVPYGKTGRNRHGIDRKSFESYLRLQDMSKTPVVLCITEEQTGDILANTLSGLGEPDPSTCDVDRKVYWDRECFRPMWSIDPGRLAAVMYLNGLPRPLPDFADNDEALKTMEKTVNFLRPKQAEFQLGHYDILAAEAVLNLSVPRHATKKARPRPEVDKTWEMVGPGRYGLPGTDYVIAHDSAFLDGWFTVTWRGQKIAERMRLEWAKESVFRHQRKILA